MNTFQELCKIMFKKRENEKKISPIILWQLGELGFQIYANDPLQFTVMYGQIHKREETHQEADLKFSLHEAAGIKKLEVTVVNPNLTFSGQGRVFALEEEIRRLAVEFPGEPRITEIAESFLAHKPGSV